MTAKSTKKDKALQIIIFIIMPLVVGGISYYLFCPSVDFVRLIDTVTHINKHIAYDNSESIIVSVMRWYLFDFLWAFSFSSAVYQFFVNKRLSYVMSVMIPVIFGIAFEVLQKYGIANGTFDIGDVFAEGIASGLSVFSNIKYETRRKRQ